MNHRIQHPPSRHLDQFMMRFPDGMRQAIKERSTKNRRSMNAEIVLILERALQSEGQMATAGDEIGVNTPAAARNTAALQGSDIINHGL